MKLVYYLGAWLQVLQWIGEDQLRAWRDALAGR